MRGTLQRRFSSQPGGLAITQVKHAKGRPAPAKKVDHLWFIGTRVPPERWPRRFGEDSFEDSAVDLVVHCLKGDQVYVFHDDRAERALRSLGTPSVWAFGAKFNPVSRFYDVVHDIAAVVEDVRDNELPRIPCEIDNKPVYFVCGHGTRDERCGIKGKEVVESLRRTGGRAFICSHLGGHAFAGNVIALPSAAWFSFVESSNAKEILNDTYNSVHFRGKSW